MPTQTKPEERTKTEHQFEYSRDGHTIGGLLRELRNDTTALVRQQVEMSRHEMSEKFSRLSRNLIFLLAGSIVAFLGSIYAVQALNQAMETWLIYGGLEAVTVQWLAPLIVGAVVLIIGGLLLLKAIKAFKKPHLSPDHTIQSLKEDAQWAQRKTH